MSWSIFCRIQLTTTQTSSELPPTIRVLFCSSFLISVSCFDATCRSHVQQLWINRGISLWVTFCTVQYFINLPRKLFMTVVTHFLSLPYTRNSAVLVGGVFPHSLGNATTEGVISVIQSSSSAGIESGEKPSRAWIGANSFFNSSRNVDNRSALNRTILISLMVRGGVSRKLRIPLERTRAEFDGDSPMAPAPIAGRTIEPIPLSSANFRPIFTPIWRSRICGEPG